MLSSIAQLFGVGNKNIDRQKRSDKMRKVEK